MIETVIWHSLLPKTIGENIRKFRKDLKLSQSDLAKKCNLASFQRKIFGNTKSGLPVVSRLC